MGRSGVLGNLMFSTLTPFFVFKVWGLLGGGPFLLFPSLLVHALAWWVAVTSWSVEPSSHGSGALGGLVESVYIAF